MTKVFVANHPTEAHILRARPGEVAAATERPWQCQRCGETIEAQFTVCWNCQTSRSDA